MSSEEPRSENVDPEVMAKIHEDLEQVVKMITERLKDMRFKNMAISFQGSSDEPKTQYLKIAEVLIASENKPRSARWLVAKTGISRSALSQILHRTHKDYFVSVLMPGYSRKKLWALTDEALAMASRQLQEEKSGQKTLFGEVEGGFCYIKATDCCAIILKERKNKPTSALTLAREALKRGYHGQSHENEDTDETLLRTAKSFWAALSRDERFEQIRPLVFVLKHEK